MTAGRRSWLGLMLPVPFILMQLLLMFRVAPQLAQESPPRIARLDLLTIVAVVWSVGAVVQVYLVESRLLRGLDGAKSWPLGSPRATLLLVGLAAANAPGIFGFVLHLLGLPLAQYRWFAVGSIAAMLVWVLRWWRRGDADLQSGPGGAPPA